MEYVFERVERAFPMKIFTSDLDKLLTTKKRTIQQSSRQNAQGFREKTGAFRKIPAVKKHLELVFITAPNRVPKIPLANDDAQGSDNSDEETGWWFSSEDCTYMAQDFTDCCKGYQESLDLVEKTFQEQGPFDGVLSFSQGAAFASLLCGVQEQNQGSAIKFNFVILIAGFKSRQSSHQSLYSSPVTIPSLHVFGDTDKVIPKEMSEDLLQYFTTPKTLQHSGGHFIPAAGPHKPTYTDFIQEMLALKSER